MRNILTLLILICVSSVSYSQIEYKRVFNYNKYQEDWTLVKSNTGNYGMIDQMGKWFFPTNYSKLKYLRIFLFVSKKLLCGL